MDHASTARSPARMQPLWGAEGKGHHCSVADGKGRGWVTYDALVATPYRQASPFATSASLAGAALALQALARPHADASAVRVAQAPADERLAAALTCVYRCLQIARRVGFLTLEPLSSVLARLYAICPPGQAAKDVGKVMVYLTDAHSSAQRCSAEWRLEVAGAALVAITAAIGDAHKPDFLSGLIAEGNLKVTSDFERLLCEACAGLVPHARQLHRLGRPRDAALEYAMLQRWLDTPYQGEWQLRRRGRLLRAYFAAYSTLERMQRAMEIVTEPLARRLPPYQAYRLRATAYRALAFVPTEAFMARLNVLAIGVEEPARSAALLVRSLAYERVGSVSCTPDPREELREELRDFRDIDSAGDAHLDMADAKVLQETVRLLFSTWVAPFDSPLATLELQRREARIIAMCNQLDGRNGGGVEIMMALVADAAKLSLPQLGHPGREQNLSLRARAIANLMMRRLGLPVAGFLEAPLPDDATGHRDALALRSAVWHALGRELTVGDKLALWNGRLGQAASFRHVATAERSALRRLMFAGLWSYDGDLWAENCIAGLDRIGAQQRPGPTMLAHCALVLDHATMAVASPYAAQRLVERMRAWCCPGDGGDLDAAAIITLTRAVRHALTVESFESLRDALFRLPGLQSAAPVLAGKVPAPGAACVSALDAAVDQVADRELSPSSRSYTVAELYAALYEDDDAGPGEALTERDFFRRQHAFIAQRDDFSPPVKTMLAELLAHLARQYGARR